MNSSAIVVGATIAATLLGGGVYLHRIDSQAQAALAEAERINLESQARLRRIQAGQEALAVARKESDAINEQRLRQIAERERGLREERIALLQREARQAEQSRLAQQQHEESLHRLAAAERQLEERRRKDDQTRARQAEQLAAEAERLHKASVIVATSQLKAQPRPVAVIMPKPAPVVIVHHIEHHHAKKPATPPRPCMLPAGHKVTTTIPARCS